MPQSLKRAVILSFEVGFELGKPCLIRHSAQLSLPSRLLNARPYLAFNLACVSYATFVCLNDI